MLEIECRLDQLDSKTLSVEATKEILEELNNPKITYATIEMGKRVKLLAKSLKRKKNA